MAVWVRTSHNRIVLSAPADASVRPSGLNATRQDGVDVSAQRRRAGPWVADVPQPDRGIVAGGRERPSIRGEVDALDTVGMAVEDPDDLSRAARGLEGLQHAGTRLIRRPFAVCLERQQQRDVGPAVQERPRGRDERQRRCIGRGAHGLASLRHRDDRQRGDQRRDARESHRQPPQGDRAPALAMDLLATALLVTALLVDAALAAVRRASSRRRRIHGTQELARDLVEVDVATALAADEPRLALRGARAPPPATRGDSAAVLRRGRAATRSSAEMTLRVPAAVTIWAEQRDGRGAQVGARARRAASPR